MIRLICLCFSFVMITQGLLAQDDWIVFSSGDEVGFIVDVPAEMVVKEQEIKTVLGTIITTTYAHKGSDEDPNYLYLINVVSYPDETFPADSTELVEEFLNDAVLQISDGVNGSVVYNSDAAFRGNSSSKIFRVTFDEDYNIIKGRAFIYKNHFISLQVYTTRENSLNDEMDSFLDSFMLTNP